jgi:Holliday junction resolvasome RuvABC DNA-binding subunit
MMEQQMLEAAQTPEMPMEQVQPEILPPSEEMPEELPIDNPQPEPQMTEDDLAFISALQDMGYDDEKIQQALAMDQMGVSNEEIIQVLEMVNGQSR